MSPRPRSWSLIALVLVASVLWAIPYALAAAPVPDGLVTSIEAPTGPPHAPSDMDENVPTLDWAPPHGGVLLVTPPRRVLEPPGVRLVRARGFPDSQYHPPRDLS